MKYRYVITNEGTVEADTEDEASVNAYDAMAEGLGQFGCEVEPIIREVTRDEQD